MRFVLAFITPLGVPKLNFASDRGILSPHLFFHIFSIISQISQLRKTENPQIGKTENPEIGKSENSKIRNPKIQKFKKSKIQIFANPEIRRRDER